MFYIHTSYLLNMIFRYLTVTSNMFYFTVECHNLNNVNIKQQILKFQSSQLASFVAVLQPCEKQPIYSYIRASSTRKKLFGKNKNFKCVKLFTVFEVSGQENCISNLNQFEEISKRTTFSSYMYKRFLPFENTTLRWSIFKSSIPVLQHYVVISRGIFCLIIYMCSL